LIILNDVAQLESETVYPKGQTDPDNWGSGLPASELMAFVLNCL
jgi:hypothetical protein